MGGGWKYPRTEFDLKLHEYVKVLVRRRYRVTREDVEEEKGILRPSLSAPRSLFRLLLTNRGDRLPTEGNGRESFWKNYERRTMSRTETRRVDISCTRDKNVLRRARTGHE
ncbi:PREDICTED: uncharacterized protein LOC105458545 [Wasmannia auropunctata]|uniref:uncharacterized protein LOC105458545 n=1 Tax=Wasmannia auropunctata TaxID=64793 RepID=UPI0005EFF28E|nr:PREDICTED: uncharacterized protein LOC105458545 [Wasmannia auropunctata]